MFFLRFGELGVIPDTAASAVDLLSLWVDAAGQAGTLKALSIRLFGSGQDVVGLHGSLRMEASQAFR